MPFGQRFDAVQISEEFIHALPLFRNGVRSQMLLTANGFASVRVFSLFSS
jgi:hypothetical protein